MSKIRSEVVDSHNGADLVCSEKDGSYCYAVVKDTKQGGPAYVDALTFIRFANRIVEWHNAEES